MHRIRLIDIAIVVLTLAAIVTIFHTAPKENCIGPDLVLKPEHAISGTFYSTGRLIFRVTDEGKLKMRNEGQSFEFHSADVGFRLLPGSYQVQNKQKMIVTSFEIKNDGAISYPN